MSQKAIRVSIEEIDIRDASPERLQSLEAHYQEVGEQLDGAHIAICVERDRQRIGDTALRLFEEGEEQS